MKTFQRISIILLLAFGANTNGQTGSVKTDLALYPQGTPPALSAAGTKTIDPVFGTQVLRVTDSADGANFGTAYSYWSTFSKNNTQILVYGDAPFIRKFDAAGFSLGAKAQLPRPAGLYSFEDALWSGLDDNKLFVHSDAKILALNTATNVYSTVADFSAQLPPNSYIWQMSRSLDDNVFAFTIKENGSWNLLGYGVYKLSTNEFLVKTFTAELDEVEIDKSGKFLVVKTGNQGAGVTEVKVIDLATKAVTDLSDNGPDFAPGHSGNGVGTVIGADNWNNAITWRTLAQPHNVRQILSFGNDWTVASHLSALADNEQSVLVSTYSDKMTGVFNNEIFTLSTDGNKSFKRLLHHYSTFHGYYDSPRANISRDGNFVAFTSNWGTNRTDLFVAKMPGVNPMPSPTPTSTPTPNPNPAASPFPKGATNAQMLDRLRLILAAMWEKMNK